MKICEECGLPLHICYTLYHYREAVKNYQRGNTSIAEEHAKDAKIGEEDYRKERRDET